MALNNLFKMLSIVFIVIPDLVMSICSGTQYWNPLNNACVDCKFIDNIECPWHDPYLYYADPSTHTCVTVCPTTPSYYANDLTQ